jgi:PhoD-like phosphatase
VAVGIVTIRPNVRRALARLTRWWIVLALVGFAVLAFGVGLPAKPHGNILDPRVERGLQICFLGLVGLAAVLAARWRGVAALVLIVAAFGLTATAAFAYQRTVVLAVAVVFLAPAVALWLVWQQQRSTATIVALGLATVAVVGAGWTVSARIYDRYFGPAHPSSTTPAIAVDRVDWIWSGGVTANSAVVVARLDDDVDVAVLDVASVAGGPRHAVRASPDDDRIVRWQIDGLEPGTDYTYVAVLDGDRDGGRGVGRFRTAPAGPRPITVAVGSCARTGSNGAVFDTIRAVGPDLYVVEGDLHYGDVSDSDPDTFLGLYGTVLTSPAQAALYRSVPVAYVWDDHDYGTNDSDAGSPSRDAARTAYRQAVPHYQLPAGQGSGAIYQAFTMGRVRFVVTDTRSERSETSMLGRRQLAWLLDEIRTTSRTHALVVWVNPDPWISPADSGRDDWGGYARERRVIADAIAAVGTHNLVMLSGDAHMVALDDGTNSDYSTNGGAGFPVLQAAALDRRGDVKGGPYSDGTFPGAGQFGTLTVRDDGGTRIRVDLTGRDWTGRTLVAHSFPVTVPNGR